MESGFSPAVHQGQALPALGSEVADCISFLALASSQNPFLPTQLNCPLFQEVSLDTPSPILLRRLIVRPGGLYFLHQSFGSLSVTALLVCVSSTL